LANSHFLFQAALDVGAGQHRSHHLGNSFLLLLGAAGLVETLLASWPGREATAWSAAILLCPLVDQAVGSNVSSDSPELLVVVLGTVFLSLLVGLHNGEC
jgi:hypothetical protein